MKHFSSSLFFYCSIAAFHLLLFLWAQNAQSKPSTKLPDPLVLFEEGAFIAFVKGRSHFDQFFEQTDQAITKELVREDLAQKYTARLAAVHLMWEHWNCANVVVQIQVGEREKCQTFRRYLDIVYDYLLRVYSEAVDPKLSEQMPAVKPKFQNDDLVQTVLNVIEHLVRISMFYFKSDFKRTMTGGLGIVQFESEPTLVNEKALGRVDELIHTYQKHWMGAEVGQLLAKIGQKIKNGDEFLEHFNDAKFKTVPKRRHSAETIGQLFRAKLTLMVRNSKQNVEKEMEAADKNSGTAKSFHAKYLGFLNSPFLVDGSD